MTATVSRPAMTTPAPNLRTPDASNPRPTKHLPMSDGHASGGSNVLDSAARDLPAPMAPTLLDPALYFAAEVLDDLERVHNAQRNRLRQLTRTERDKDGEERGFGLNEAHPDVARLAAMVDVLKKLEHEATLELKRKLRKHPLYAWVKAQRGIGEKQGARLLAAIRDPYINSAKDAPRTVSALWAYCGLHVLPGGHSILDTQAAVAAGDQHRDIDHPQNDAHHGVVGVAAKRRKGERANWSTKAKMRAYLIAESCIKQLDPQCRDGHQATDAQADSAVPACACSPYRVVYDARRARTAITRPEWTDGHSHNDAVRVASKAILKDLWRAARDWHSAQGVTR